MMKRNCSWSKELKESKSYKEMLGVVLNVDEIVRCEILKKKFKVDKEDIIRYYKDTDWEREYLGERFWNEINKEIER